MPDCGNLFILLSLRANFTIACLRYTYHNPRTAEGTFMYSTRTCNAGDSLANLSSTTDADVVSGVELLRRGLDAGIAV